MLEIAIISAVIGYTYTVLMDENMILFWWWKIITKYLSGWKLYLLTCGKCVSGQIALWSCVYCGIELIDSIFVICLSILSAKILERWS